MFSFRFGAALLGLFISLGITAQSTITGRVVDPEGTALIGVSIIAQGTTIGTVSDADGQFSLSIPNDVQVLLLSYVGYATQRIDLEGRDFIDAVLTKDAVLDQVVVTALGLERSNSELGYAVQALKSEELIDVQAPNFLDNLSGQFAGVTVTAGATGVGSTSKITIRGESSFTNNNPLFVVDGVPINNNTIINTTNEAAAGYQEVDFGNGAMEVNPADVASVSVLKGPSAAALYGTRAANGVILINTKRGGSQEGIGVSFNTSFTVDRPFQLPQYQNIFGQGQGGVFEFVDGLGSGTSDNITYSYGPRLDAGIN
ncbi:MAG: TonB-dependent receptor plug domain-containing protein, partial [Bacteroidota bacterium]